MWPFKGTEITHEHDWGFVSLYASPGRNETKHRSTATMYWMSRCECGQFRVSSSETVTEGKLPECVQKLSDVGVGKYLMRHVPRRDWPRRTMTWLERLGRED